MQAPPPYRPVIYTNKIILMGFQCALLMIAALIIYAFNHERESNNDRVIREITAEWGRSVYITGPFINNIAPEKFDCKIDVKTVPLHRGIYQAEVYQASVEMHGKFNPKTVLSRAVRDSVFLRILLPAKQIANLEPIKFGDASFDWDNVNDYIGINAIIPACAANNEFTIRFDIKGSNGLSIAEVGENSSVEIHGISENPSFNGNLPLERTVDKKLFSASWQSHGPSNTWSNREHTWANRYNHMYYDDVVEEVYPVVEYDDSVCVINPDTVSENTPKYASVQFLVGVDYYQMVARSLKYAFIIILLTFASVLLTEVLTRKPIPLLNYFLIGGALVLFYSLLLSFSEIVGFSWAYLIASFMTITLIAVYLWNILKSHKNAIINSIILVVIYACIYVLLSATTYALLIGSLIIFVVIAAMMYLSIRIENNEAHNS